MYDISHQWGADLLFGPAGDLALSSAAALGQQRVLRRLLTNPFDYIWHTTYGAGLAQFVGEPVDEAQIGAVIRGQIFREAAVARSPAPTISVTAAPGNSLGSVYVGISYSDPSSSSVQTVNFTVGG